MSYPRSRYRPRPPYRGNPLLVARIPFDEWRAVHDYADQRGITISEVIREALRGVIQRVITTPSATAETAGGAQPSEVTQATARAEAIKGRLYDKRVGTLSFGQNKRLPRLEDQRPSDITPAVPAFDHMQIAAQKAGYDTVEDWRNAGLPIQGRPPNHPQGRKPKFTGKLTDKR